MKTRKATPAERAQYDSGIRPFYQALQRINLNIFPKSGPRLRAHLRVCRLADTFRKQHGFVLADRGLRVKVG